MTTKMSKSYEKFRQVGVAIFSITLLLIVPNVTRLIG